MISLVFLGCLEYRTIITRFMATIFPTSFKIYLDNMFYIVQFHKIENIMFN